MEITLTLGVLSGLVVGLTEVIKRLGVPTKYIPLSAIIISLVLNLIFFKMGGETSQVILTSLVAALTAMGFYSGGKATVER
jgi:hypothetical protein